MGCPERRGKRRTSWAAISGALVTLVALVGPATASPTYATAAALPPPWPKVTVATAPASLGFFPEQIEPGTELAVGPALSTGVPGSAFGSLYQADLTTGKLARGSLVFEDGRLVTIGTSLAYVEPRTELVEPNGQESPSSPASSPLEEIRLLRPGTPLVESADYVPITRSDSVAPWSPSASSVWVGTTGAVEELDLTIDKVMRRIALPEPAGQFEVSLYGSTLYAMANAVGSQPIEIYAVSLSSDKVVGSRAILGVGGYAVAVPGGVWISYRTGMLGTAVLLSYPSLTTKSPAPARLTSPAPLPGTSQGMGIAVTVTGQTAWLVDISAVSCVSATTGHVLADASLGSVYGGFSILGSVGQRLYALTGDRASGATAVVELKVPATCWR